MAGIVYGFKHLLDRPDRRATEVDQRQLQSAIAYSQQQHDRELALMLNLFAEPTTAIQKKFRGGGSITENQPLDQFGRSRKIKGERLDYTAGFPIWSSGQARGMNFITRAKMTIQQFNDELDAIYRGDFRWIRNRLFARMFIKGTIVFDDLESDTGEVSTVGMADGDTVKYAYVGSDDIATEDHYRFFANPIDDANNPLPAIRSELIEHEVNGSEADVVVFISSSLVLPTPTTGVMALTDFVEFQSGDPALSQPPDLIRILRPLRMALPAGARYLGRSSLCHVVEWSAIPSGYGFGMVVGGQRPFMMRQDEEAVLRGFKPVATREDFPYFEDQWIRRLGFGGWNRLALVPFLVGAGAYATPAIYQNMRW